ncbi:MAG: hypothetical protein MZV64_63790 [Ignavibacteriales bacterium]|nr:hypothetical protein [Ignavibacteriales bacterium]
MTDHPPRAPFSPAAPRPARRLRRCRSAGPACPPRAPPSRATAGPSASRATWPPFNQVFDPARAVPLLHHRAALRRPGQVRRPLQSHARPGRVLEDLRTAARG